MALLLALHAGLFGILLNARHEKAAAPSERLMLVSIKPAERPRPPPTPRTLPRGTPAQPQRIASSMPVLAGSGTAPLAVAEQAGQPTAPVAASAPAPLNLSLPPGSAKTETLTKRNPALTDPRSHSTRRSVEQRLAQAMGGRECSLEERLPDGTIVRVPGHFSDVPTASASADPFGHARSTGGGFGGGASLGGGGGGGGGTVTVCLRDNRY